ncbi:DUF2268 domain-containing putative Zn-dependent protease [Anaerosporobacter faecicola]|uniref:DUF2268 domain-containing putative Zn-dependent protease n=1 Tax=Anaerosporobacter faecicola TaxID=2718714 RepID=UPI00143997B2|nr:DUF2268 domain-containing putative Zn-dependent protease [Anaerosporobacter faecicola]
MKFDLILAYRNLSSYIAEGTGEDAWNKTMIDPFWGMLTQGAPFPMDHMKPLCNMEREIAEKQLELLEGMDWGTYSNIFEEICSRLPKEDEDTMHIAIYPSTNTMPEGIYGTGVWGNIILNINPMIESATRWIPYVFAHEFHHAVWGDYWYCKQGGAGLTDSFLERLIIEGEADAFARSLNPAFIPSWHKGVRHEEEQEVWIKFQKILNETLNPDEISKYMFGCRELGIPENAGYYYAIQIIDSYLKDRDGMTFLQLLKISPDTIYKEAQFRLGDTN